MKTTKTYSIEESIFNAFDSLTSERNINKSSFIEESIRKFLKDNDMDFVDKLYCLKTNQNHIVTVISQDKSYYTLDDGSKIQKILFMQIFEEIIPVKPEYFFEKSSKHIENIIEKIKEIDETKIEDVPYSSINKFKEKYPIDTKDHSEIEKKNSIILNEINSRYRSGDFINKDRFDLCTVLAELKKIYFTTQKEIEMQDFLIGKITQYKDSAAFPDYANAQFFYNTKFNEIHQNI